ncbi:MAG: PEP-CTERM sorting domain-containing protein [Chthoniobacter sp.]|uniref:PEP-CTERM sorting domain-containing protein n=1 Tax=Chthoniobacter sp. TaxID=2510640 RepID=UPI0032A239DE
MKMKTLHSLLGVSILALVGSIAGAGSANAAVTVSNGDLYLGFRATGGTGSSFDYLIDIGQASIYKNATSSFVLNSASGINIGNIGIDLANTFGANWATRSDLFWGVVGTVNPLIGTDPLNTEYASKGENTFGTPETAWNSRANSAQNQTNTAIVTLRTTLSNDTAAPNSTRAAIQSTGEAGSWFSAVHAADGGGVSFNSSYDSSLEGSFAGGPNGTALDLFRLPVSASGAAGTYLGNFTTDSTGNITFNVASVPEPSTLTALAGGAALLGLVRRRRSAIA